MRALLPGIPGRVAVVFHALYERPGVAKGSATWNSSTESSADAETATEAIVAGSTHVYSSPGSDDEIGRRIRWKALAESLGVPWSLDIGVDSIRDACGGSWPAHLWGPEQGSLDDEQLGVLAKLMTQAGATSTAIATHPFFRCDPMGNWRWTFNVQDILNVRQHPINTFGDGPSQVMAADGSWYLLQDIDHPYTLLLASDDVIREVLQHPVLETLEVPPTDRG